MCDIRKICHDSLRDDWHKGQNTQTEVHEMHGQDPSNFIKERLETTWPNYHKHNSAAATRAVSQYRCMRSGKPTRGSYLRVGCKAYISYKKDTCPTLGTDVVLERVYDVHSGHDPFSNEDKHLANICPELVSQIMDWIELGVSSEMMLVKAHEWALDEGHTSLHDARYFVTPDDIKNLRKSAVRATQLDAEDSTSLNRMVTEKRPEDFLYYQEYIKDQQPLILVIHTEQMKSDWKSSQASMVFLDATNCVNKYGYPLWSLVATNKFGRGVPIAHIISSSETKETLEVALQQLKNANVVPRAFMVDKDYREILAVQAVFPDADVLLCYFHMLQAVHRWMSSRNSSLYGTGHGLKRNLVIEYFAKLKRCRTKEDFNVVCEDFHDQFPDHDDLIDYFEDNWRPIAQMWAAFGRHFNHNNADTNNLAERFFLRLKHQFLGKKRNRRLDALVEVLLNRVQNYFTILHNLREVGRIKDAKIPHALAAAGAAERMLRKGWAEKILNLGDGNYITQSEFDIDRSYCVNIPDCSCTCPQSETAVMCKHVHLVRQLQQTDHPSFGSLEVDLAAGCEFLRPHVNNIWQIDEEERCLKVNMLDSDTTIKASITACSCVGFSFYDDCSHIILAKSVLPPEWRERPPREQSQNVPENPDASEPDIPFAENEAIAMLNALLKHFENTQTVPDRSTHAFIKKAHDRVFMNDTGDRRRKVVPLYPNRTIPRIQPQPYIPPVQSCSRPVVSDSVEVSVDVAKPAKKRRVATLKTSFGRPSKKVAMSKSTTPSMKTIRERNKRQDGLISVGDMKVNKAGYQYVDDMSVPPATDSSLSIAFFADMVLRLRILSTDTIEDLSNEVITANLKKFFKKKFKKK